MASSSSSLSSSVSSAVPVAVAAAPSPITATTALSQKTFWQNGQFFPLCRFLFAIYQGNPVWTQMRPESFRQLCIHMHNKLEQASGSEDFPIELIKNIYFLIIKTVRGPKTNQQFHAAESPKFLQGLYNTYKYLRTFGPMPHFGKLS